MFVLDAKQRLYVVLLAVFLTSLLVADIVAGKYFVVGDLQLSTGTVIFPIAFLLTDVVNEYYGRRGARFMTFVGMAMLVFGFGIIYAARVLPVWDRSPIPQPAFDAVFGISARLFVASLVAYLISQFVDIYTFHITKRVTRSRFLWVRALGSTALSQIVDTGAVTFGSLLGLIPVGDIVAIAVGAYVYKMVVATLLTPLLYVSHDIISKRMGIDPAPAEDEGDA
jgi:uncharacterized integral membrane protein (TIGR00697 family)